MAAGFGGNDAPQAQPEISGQDNESNLAACWGACVHPVGL